MGLQRRYSRNNLSCVALRLEILESRVLLSATGAARPVPADVGSDLASVFLSASADEATVGTPVSFVAHVVSADNADGCVVDFVDGTTGGVIGSQAVSNGAASLTWSAGLTGSHAIFAQLEAGQPVAGTASAPQMLTIEKGVTTSLLSQTGAGIVATISAGGSLAKGGSVSFFEGTKVLGTVQVGANGTALLPVSALRAGSHSIVAAYNGSSQLMPSTSTELVVVIGGSSGGSHVAVVPHGRGHWALPMVESPAVRKNVKAPVVVKHKR